MDDLSRRAPLLDLTGMELTVIDRDRAPQQNLHCCPLHFMLQLWSYTQVFASSPSLQPRWVDILPLHYWTEGRAAQDLGLEIITRDLLRQHQAV